VLFLNLFYVTPKGVEFYWQQNFNVEAILVYVAIALSCSMFYKLISLAKKMHTQGKIKVSEKVWFSFSLFFIILIVYLT